MKDFMDENFLLQNETAVRLFHTYAKTLPIIDYHCHLSAKEICENRPAYNLTQLWLQGDHYKWRVMRANGIQEEKITGNADDYDKFEAYAETMPFAIGNPLYHWTHLELQRYFDIKMTLEPETAGSIWKETEKQLSDGKHTPRHFIETSNVYALCTTEDPADSLIYHEQLQKDISFHPKIYPAFRPDNALAIEKKGWKEYLLQLEKAAGIRINTFDALLNALQIRMDAFAKMGCRASDHGFESMPYKPVGKEKARAIFLKAYHGTELTSEEKESYQTELLLWLGACYAERNWAMELHINAMRSCNTRMVELLGEATGYDSVCDHAVALKLSGFMNALEEKRKLPKMILFSLNDADNLVMAALTGTFQDASIPSKIQMGTAWWFQDHQDGMERQMQILANEGLLGRFIGMLTDSRSFLSYPRHEYFRRILCNLLGTYVENGRYPNNEKYLKMLVEGICFYNAKQYFNL